MPQISAIFAAFQQGEIRFETLDAAVGKIVAESPERVAEVQAALQAAKDDGLPWHVYAVLRGNLDLIEKRSDQSLDQGSSAPCAPSNIDSVEDETIVLGNRDQDPTTTHTSETGAGETGTPTDGTTTEDDTRFLEERNVDATTAPLRGSVADNAKRLARDRQSTERTLMNYLGEDFADDDSDLVTSKGDIFSQPFTEDEIAATELTKEPGQTQMDAVEGEFRPGYMLRKRFQLQKKLGEGGMGEVWRARDMLKVRARDRNPYVAIKLLTGDFREHPEAFIALQRETSKQQRLAHPNIATVFNFDRDESIDTVFMTMEVMEGESMDKFIRKLPAGGLTEAEAMPIIEQLGAGLSYAHQNALVHSDLKPGNCFLTRTGVVKLLDFGIARASKTEAHAEGERTLFDPGKLGAITPAYATVEMFEGLDPDPRDDIFALAIIAFQLFTGKHPFGRQRADKAISLGLEVPHVAKLSKRQNRGLARGLAFKREDRTGTVEEFLQALRPAKRKTAAYITGGIAAALIVGALANPAFDLMRARENSSIIKQIEAGTPAELQMGIARIKGIESEQQQRKLLQDKRTVTAMTAAVERSEGDSLDLILSLIAGLDPDWQQDFFGHQPVRQAILKNFQTRINASFDPRSDKLDYARAWAHFQKLDALYPSSASVLTIRNALERNRNDVVADLESEYERLLELGAIVPVEADRDIADTLSDLKMLMPGHPLLSDARLTDRVTELAGQFLQAGEFDAAARYIDAGLGYTTENTALEQLRVQLTTLVEKTEREQLGASLHARLEAARPKLDTLEGYQPIKRDLVTLSVLDPEDPLALSLQRRHKELFQQSYDARVEAGEFDAAGDVLVSNAPMLETAYLIAARARLSAAENAVMKGDVENEDHYSSGLETLARHVASAKSDIAWSTDALVGIRAFTAALPPGDLRLEKLRSDVVAFLLFQATQAASTGRFDAGRNWIARARLVSPTDAALDQAAVALEAAATEAVARRDLERNMAQFEALRNDFAAALSEKKPEEAEKHLIRMREIADDSAEISEQSVALIGDAYAALGEAYAGKMDYDSAVRIVSAAIDAGWASAPMNEALAHYRDAFEQRALIFALRSRIEGSAPLDIQSIESDLEALGQQFPEEINQIRADLAARRSASIVAFLSSKDFDARMLDARMTEFARLFPHAAESMRSAVSEGALKRVEAESQRDPLAARRLLEQMSRVLRDHPELQRIARALPPASILEARSLIASGRLTQAAATLKADREAIGGLAEYAALNRTIALKQAQAKQKFKMFVSRVKTGALESREMRLAAFGEVQGLWSDNPEFSQVDYIDREPGACLSDIAGEGRNNGGTCFDLMPDGARGPLMVVVPPATGGERPFAIGKYEVSVAEFNRFCTATAACKETLARNDKLPVTGISLTEAKSYADWLSVQAATAMNRRVVYRLPNDREWQHAAAARGEVSSRAINCRPEGGSSLTAGLITSQGGSFSLGMPIGRSLVSATFGEANGWGVVNAVGNAQEWAITGAGVVARGGAFEDPAASCSVDAGRSHDGSADPVTGFRLVRELD